MINSILSAGLQGIQQSLSRANKHVDVITRPSSDGSYSEADLVSAFIGLKQEQRNLSANRKVIQVAEEMQSSLDLIV